jgi:hypothetical protein
MKNNTVKTAIKELRQTIEHVMMAARAPMTSHATRTVDLHPAAEAAAEVTDEGAQGGK